MYELLMQNMRGTEQVGRGDNQPAIDAMIVPSRAGRASLWARSRPCVVVGAEPAMRRPAGLLDLRRCCAAARRGVRGIPGVLRRASGAQFLIARRGRRSGRRSTASTTARSRVPRRAARRPSTASRRTSPRRPRAVLLRCSAFLHQVGINVRRRRARLSTTSTSSRATSDGLASVARLLYALVALGLAYIRCVENADDLTRHARVSPRWTRRRPGQITPASHEAGTDHGASRRRRAPGSICSSARRSYSIEPNV